MPVLIARQANAKHKKKNIDGSSSDAGDGKRKAMQLG
jgi:hypothetical protein